MCCSNRRLITVKEAGFKRYVGASYPKSLQFFFPINRRSKTLFESLLPEKKAKCRQESGFEAYFRAFCPNTLLVYFEDSRSKTCLDSLFPEKIATAY